MNTRAFGEALVAVDLQHIPTRPPTIVLSGETWSLQSWHRDGATSNFTDGLEVRFE